MIFYDILIDITYVTCILYPVSSCINVSLIYMWPYAAYISDCPALRPHWGHELRLFHLDDDVGASNSLASLWPPRDMHWTILLNDEDKIDIERWWKVMQSAHACCKCCKCTCEALWEELVKLCEITVHARWARCGALFEDLLAALGCFKPQLWPKRSPACADSHGSIFRWSGPRGREAIRTLDKSKFCF